jgi:ubiquinone/menaquinone biosynthesis C-methylase UbiE
MNRRYFRFTPPSDDPIAYARKQSDDGRRVWNRFFAGRVALEGKVVLDLGCGPGGKTCNYMTLGPKRVVGVDNSYDAIAQAERARDVLVPPEDRHKLEFACVDAGDLPFPDEYFDVITCSDSFEHFPNARKVLSEAARVLKEHGLMAVDFAQWGAYNGHHLGDIIATPWCHIFWSREAITGAVEKIVELERSRLKDEKSRDALDDLKKRRIEHFLTSLNGLSLGAFERYLKEEKRLGVLWSRKTSAWPVLWPLIFVPGARELAVARNVYVMRRTGS